MKGKQGLLFFCALCFCLCWFLVTPQAEPWYRISETELQKLETISRGWQTDKQTWLSQASVLKQVAQDLQEDSATLNRQLAAERTKTQSLRNSFEQYAADQLRRASEYEAEIVRLTAANGCAKIETEQVKNQRNILFFCLVILVLAGSLVALSKRLCAKFVPML